MHSFVVQNLPEFIKSNPLPTAKNPPMAEPIHAPQKEWDAVYYYAAAQVDPLACCLLELRDRVVALEAAGSVAGNSGHVSAAPAGVSAEELADSLPANAWAGPEGYSRQAFARHLLDHPRIGPLLRGEGAPAPKRVVLPEDPPFRRMPYVEGPWSADDLARAVWAAARAEIQRQQGKQSPQTQEKSNDY